MRPLHASVTRLSRCPCCVSKYAKKQSKAGRKAARARAKRDISAMLRCY